MIQNLINNISDIEKFNVNIIKSLATTVMGFVPNMFNLLLGIHPVDWLVVFQNIALATGSLSTIIIIGINAPKLIGIMKANYVTFKKSFKLKKAIVGIIAPSNAKLNIIKNEIIYNVKGVINVTNVDDAEWFGIDVLIVVGTSCDTLPKTTIPIIRVIGDTADCDDCGRCEYIIRNNHSSSELLRLILKCL